MRRTHRASRVHTKPLGNMLQVQDPGGVSSVSPLTTLRILPSPLRDRVGHLTTDRFRGYSFHLRCGLLPPCLRFETIVPAHTLRMGGPRAPQNSVPGCWLGFAGATIAGRLVLCASRRTSHRTVLVLFTYGSSGQWVINPIAGRVTTSPIPTAAPAAWVRCWVTAISATARPQERGLAQRSTDFGSFD